MAQMCPAKSTIVPFKKQMYSSGSIILSYKDDKCICVSIHAPTRGATYNKTLELSVESFQSTHPRGVRPQILLMLLQSPAFQSTHPRGVRPILLTLLSSAMRFQSTHPRGVRLNDAVAAVCLYVWFQSTHPRGVRQCLLVFYLPAVRFQSTHPRGVRLLMTEIS